MPLLGWPGRACLGLCCPSAQRHVGREHAPQDEGEAGRNGNLQHLNNSSESHDPEPLKTSGLFRVMAREPGIIRIGNQEIKK